MFGRILIGAALGVLAAEYRDRAGFVAVNAAKASALAQTYRISAVPTVILFHRGQERARWPGVEKADVYRAGLESLLKPAPQEG